MRVLLDANVILDCLVCEPDGQPRSGRAASEQLLDLCDQAKVKGIVAWHTLPILAYFHSRQNTEHETAAMINDLLTFLEVPTVGHQDAARWQSHQVKDFEDALQVSSALAGNADVIVTRNTADFDSSPLQVMTPEAFLAAYTEE